MLQVKKIYINPSESKQNLHLGKTHLHTVQLGKCEEVFFMKIKVSCNQKGGNFYWIYEKCKWTSEYWSIS